MSDDQLAPAFVLHPTNPPTGQDDEAARGRLAEDLSRNDACGDAPHEPVGIVPDLVVDEELPVVWKRPGEGVDSVEE
jgi:hypothetical protein